MPRATYGKKWGRVRTITVKDKSKNSKSAEDVVRDLKRSEQKQIGEDYRGRSLALHGLICARCGREFDEPKRHLLTVHHKDGNHDNNPQDGSNWENLCVYCHEDAHSRGILGDYLEGASVGTSGGSESSTVYEDVNVKDANSSGRGSLGDKLKEAFEKKR